MEMDIEDVGKGGRNVILDGTEFIDMGLLSSVSEFNVAA